MINLKVCFNKICKLYSQYCSAKRELAALKVDIAPFMRERDSKVSLNKRILIVSMGWYDAKTESIYAKALEEIGYEAYIVTRWDPFVTRIFDIFGIKNIHFYHNYYKRISSRKIRKEALNILDNHHAQDILKVTKNGVQVGKYATSSFMRITRSSSVDLKDKKMRKIFVKQLILSLRAAAVAESVLDHIAPQLLFVMDRGYTPVGQFFDNCLDRNIPIIQRCGSHKSGSEILKRFSSFAMSSTHHYSLSKESWGYIKDMPWSDSMWREVQNEFYRVYSNGDWFGEVGTQFNKKIYSKQELVSKLKIDSKKKTAVIFAHMFWDATFFWGEDLFKDYYDWFVNLLKIAEQNKNLNWIIKIHPANVVKARRDNYRSEHREIVAIKETLGNLPEHIKLIAPESEINTFSLFDFMDYCLTVRGTIGVEAASFGVPVLTAGTGRYDRLGFTRDFNSKEEYLNCIKYLETVPSAMTEEQLELAQRYAYAVFLLKPIHLDLLEHGYEQDDKATMRFRPLFKTKEEFEKSKFVQNFRNFVSSGKEDFMNLDRIPNNFRTLNSEL